VSQSITGRRARWPGVRRTAIHSGHSQHRGPGALDLLVAATAVHHDLTVMRVDNDFPALAPILPELRERDART